ncbi:MAG: ATP-binding protein [Saprospiraceae bacterium]|nr:ATP-binding protein [Saprospiraceae bacterium]
MKKEKIDQIDNIDSLIGLISQLLEKMGLSAINRIADNIIEAKEPSPLKKRKTYFIFTLSELNGKTPTIGEIVLSIKHDADNIYIVTSNRKISDYFKKWLKYYCDYQNIDFWARDIIVELVDEHLSSFWGHGDSFIQAYEENFIEKLENDKELKKLLKLDDKYDKLLNIFIEPKLFVFAEDKETQRTIQKRIRLENIVNNENHIISGDAGTGKSTVLKEVGKKIVTHNRNAAKKSIPILINSSTLFQNNFDLNEIINSELDRNFSEFGIDKVLNGYNIVLLIDSIDEFEKVIRQKILNDLSEYGKRDNFSFLLCTRNYKALISGCEICEHGNPFLSNFDLRQVKLFLDNFFRFDLAKSDKLWEILMENNTLEKIPITPLTISLISILYEDKGYEIPATITDVYDNFSLFLLGKINVSSRLDFLNINIKKRVISSYALIIIESENKSKKSVNEFVEYIVSFFSQKSISINKELVPELLQSLTDGTGVLYIDENGYVAFKHDHFMEYYASVEIFDHYRDTHEKTLIDNFNNFNWQNTAIFYAGRTKDMSGFITDLISHIKSYQLLNDCLLGVSGMGYVLQSLWLTDSIRRKEGVKVALDLLIKADSEVKKLAASKFPFFQKIRNPDIAIMNLVWFYKHFNSITLKDPLNLAFEDIHKELKITKSSQFRHDSETFLYQLFCIAATLDTGRNADSEKLQILFDEDNILTIPLFVLLFEVGLEVLETENREKLKESFKLKNRVKKYIDGIKFYLDTPAEDLRFTTLDSIVPPKKVEIYTEGKSDALIINHAFQVLTNNKDSHWKVSSCESSLKSNSGGANQLAKLLVDFSQKIETEYDRTKTIIGVFDNDSKGCQEFNGFREDFIYIDERIRKHKKLNIYAIKLPIPPHDEYNSYHQEKQSFRFFEIEHYFSLDFLTQQGMVESTPIPNVYEIKNKKSDFAESILKLRTPELFKNFTFLFRQIDNIIGIEESYIE